jgi:uncharacterized protein (TIGR02996 family)
MPTDDALLRAVITDPDDDAPRLIYADWLDVRGNFIDAAIPALRERFGDGLATKARSG